MKKAELLKTDHQVQLNWLENQITKIANDGAKSFSNADVAERAYNKIQRNSLIVILSTLSVSTCLKLV